MNKERLLAIAGWLEAGAKHPNIQFDMERVLELRTEDDWVIKESSEHWIRPPHHCRACVAGVAAMTYAPSETALSFSFNADPNERESIYSIARESIYSIARRVLGLTDSQALQLFVPYVGIPYDQITPQMAAKAIRSFVETGVIDGYTWEDAAALPEYHHATPDLPASAE